MARIWMDERCNSEVPLPEAEAGVGEGGGERSSRTSDEALIGVDGMAPRGGGVCGSSWEKVMGSGGVEVMTSRRRYQERDASAEPR